MSIQDFYQRFVSVSENNVLVESLRHLSLLEDPKAMFAEEAAAEWQVWSGGGTEPLAGQV